jgi:cytochrome c oxidase assembly protein subunit 11
MFFRRYCNRFVLITTRRRLCAPSDKIGSSHSRSSSARSISSEANKKVAYYFSALAILVLGASYASVPLYKIFCQVTGFGGTTQRLEDTSAAVIRPSNTGRVVRVDFSSSVHSALPWKFTPTQRSVNVTPGETALAFYTVRNNSDKAITGVATYNVSPPKVGLYFNKIQCFCFEEQRLGPHEEIDMPVFFLIDPDFEKDVSLTNVDNVILSYTFFKTGEEEVVAPSGAKSEQNQPPT